MIGQNDPVHAALDRAAEIVRPLDALQDEPAGPERAKPGDRLPAQLRIDLPGEEGRLRQVAPTGLRPILRQCHARGIGARHVEQPAWTSGKGKTLRGRQPLPLTQAVPDIAFADAGNRHVDRDDQRAEPGRAHTLQHGAGSPEVFQDVELKCSTCRQFGRKPLRRRDGEGRQAGLKAAALGNAKGHELGLGAKHAERADRTQHQRQGMPRAEKIRLQGRGAGWLQHARQEPDLVEIADIVRGGPLRAGRAIKIVEKQLRQPTARRLAEVLRRCPAGDGLSRRHRPLTTPRLRGHCHLCRRHHRPPVRKRAAVPRTAVVSSGDPTVIRTPSPSKQRTAIRSRSRYSVKDEARAPSGSQTKLACDSRTGNRAYGALSSDDRAQKRCGRCAPPRRRVGQGLPWPWPEPCQTEETVPRPFAEHR